MRIRPYSLAAGLIALALVVAGCGEEGSSDDNAGSGNTDSSSGSGGGGAECAPIAGDELLVLEDDQELQTVDNLIPAVSAAASTPELLAALNAVSAAMDTDTLVELNGRIANERLAEADAAADFFDEAGLAEGLEQGSGEITIGSSTFPETVLLANIYSLTLDAAGFDTSIQSVGNRELYLPALQSGEEIQVFPEYVGTLTEFLNAQANGPEPEPLASGDLEATVTELTTLGESVGLVFGEPSEAADQNAFAVTQAFADEYGVTTLSELAETCTSGLVLGGPPECPERPFCQAGLEETYGLVFDSFTSLDAGGPLTKTAITTGQVSIGLVFSSDGSLA
ncbi:MAG: glycine betaine ABC transporter substrate-binding protein [Geodermatophilaceae bacterium]